MGRIGYDPMVPNVDFLVFNDNAYWTEFYRNVEEELLQKIMEPRGRDVSIYLFVDDSNAPNIATRRSHNGIIMLIQNAPIIYFSEKQNRV